MIVRQVHGRLQLITQPDHAHLARAIVERCVGLEAHPRRAAILHAAGEHDNGWAEEDAVPIVHPETGEVADFMNAPAEVRRRVWPRGVGRLADDPWAAALVAEHALTVYGRLRSDAAWHGFFAAIEGARDQAIAAAGISAARLGEDYPFVRLGDLVSLAFCTAGFDAERAGPWTVHVAGTRVTVTPDAFGGATVPLVVTCREVARRRFRSDADLRDALANAGTSVLRGEASGRGLARPFRE